MLSTLEYLYGLQRSGIKFGLDNITNLLSDSGVDYSKMKFIHVAGTNGKGSTCNMLSQILQCSGYKTGLFTSPHVAKFNERIRVNGVEIPDSTLAELTEFFRPAIEKHNCTFFEVSTAIGIKYFLDQQVDVAVMEVGLGGRLDSTNIITPLLSIITGIDYDHQQMLGYSLIEIAREKAGIIKRGIPVVVNDKRQFVRKFISGIAAKRCCKFVDAAGFGEISTLKLAEKREIAFRLRGKELQVDFNLTPTYQLFNLKTVLSAVKILRKSFQISDQNLLLALSTVSVKGRMQYLSLEPRLMMDAAHNPEGFNKIRREVKLLKFKSLHLITGAVKDKDYEKYLKIILSFPGKKYFVQPQIDRGLDIEKIKHFVENQTDHDVAFFPTVPEGYLAAIKNYQPGDLIFVTGSHFVLGDLVNFLDESKEDK